MLGNYYELCRIAKEDETLSVRVDEMEQRLRAFCQAGGGFNRLDKNELV